MIDHDVRDGFTHSDYAITDEEFRLTRGVGRSLSLKEVSSLLKKALGFYSRFVALHRSGLDSFKRDPRYTRLNDYRVLELLKDPDGSVCGFAIHFSNDTRAVYRRTSSRIVCENMILGVNGVEFHEGDRSALRNEFRVEGKPFTEESR